MSPDCISQWCAGAPGELAPLAFARPWRIPSPLAHAERLDSVMMPRWCARVQMVCAQVNRGGEELGVRPSEFHQKKQENFNYITIANANQSSHIIKKQSREHIMHTHNYITIANQHICTHNYIQK